MNAICRKAMLPAVVSLWTCATAALAGAAEQRVAETAAMLPSRPAGLGRPIADRPAWGRLAANDSYRSVVRQAEGLLALPLPETTDELYLDFSKTGNRTRWQRVAGQRRGRIGTLTLAECAEDKGRFLAPLERVIAAVCAERTWVMPAHDRGLRNFKGEMIDIDLGAAHLGWDLATCRWLLGEKLSAGSRKQIADELRRRIFEPYLETVAGRSKANWWTRGTNNWNAVCLAGVTGAALATIEPAAERARFVAAAEDYSLNFLKGFTPDGYCSEGLGYWGYGFGHYVLLSETIRQATAGKLDLLARDAARAPATFAERIEIVGGVCPAFADCGVTTRPSWTVVHFLRRRYGLGAAKADDEKMIHASSSLGQAMVYSFPNAATEAPAVETPPAGLGLRTFFPDAGVLICRPAEGTRGRFGVAMKGGHNAEHHNHNDVGSYVVAVGGRPVLLDPGSEVYTARTFSGKRYDSKVLNSYGHPVPVVAGKLQKTGRKAAGQVVRTDFADAADTLVLDLRAAYDAGEVTKLQRTFVYSRAAPGSLAVTDEVDLAAPAAFETALVTLGRWKKLPDGSLLVYDFDQAVRVEVSATGGEVELRAETIKEDLHTRSLPTRIGIAFRKPVSAAAITVRIAPVERALEGEASGLLRNGSFEHEDWCWEIPVGGMAALSIEQAAAGKRSLKIVDDSKTDGSSISSARIPAAGEQRCELRGKVYGVSGGERVGLYVKYFDDAGRLLNETSARGHIQPVGSVGGVGGKWTPFAFGFRTPAGTAGMQVWIHSYSTAKVTAYLDELQVVPVQ